MPNDVELNQKHSEQQEVQPHTADTNANAAPEGIDEVFERLTAEGEQQTNAMLNGDPAIYTDVIENDQESGDSVLGAQIAESEANIQTIVANTADKRQTLVQRRTEQWRKIMGPKPEPATPEAALQKIYDDLEPGESADLADGSGITKPLKPTREQRLAAKRDAIIADARNQESATKDADFAALVAARTQSELDKKLTTEHFAAGELAHQPEVAADKKINEDFFGKDVAEGMARGEGFTESDAEKSEAKVHEALVKTLKKTRDTMAAYQIAEFKPILGELNADLKRLSPRELIAKYTGEEEVAKLDEKGKPVKEKGKIMMEKIPKRLIPEKVLIDARIRIEAELGQSSADVLKEIEQADERAKRSFSEKATDSVTNVGDAVTNAATSTVDAIADTDRFDVINLPFKMAKLPFQGIAAAAKLPFKKLITVPAMLGTRAVGNMSRAAWGRARYGVDTPLMKKSEFQQFKGLVTVDRSVEELQGLEKLSDLNENFGNSQFDAVIAQGEQQAKEAGTYTEKKPAYEDTDTASAENILYTRLLSKVIDGINDGSIMVVDKEAAIKAIAKTSDPKSLFTIDAANHTAQFTLPEHLEGYSLDTAVVEQEQTIATDYLVKHEKTLREVVKAFAQRFTGNDTAMFEAIQNGQFSSKFDDRGKWVLRVQVDSGTGLEANEITIDPKFSEVVLKGITDKQVDEATNELPLEYITGQIKGLEPWKEAGGRKGPAQGESAPDQKAATKAAPEKSAMPRDPSLLSGERKANKALLGVLESSAGDPKFATVIKFIADNPGQDITAHFAATGELVIGLESGGDATVSIDRMTYDTVLKPKLGDSALTLEANTEEKAAA